MLAPLRHRWHSPGGLAEVLRIAWPLILSNSFWTFQLALDRVLLSRYNTAALAAAQTAAMWFWTPLILLLFTTGYSTTFVAQYLGAKQNHRVGPAVWQGLYFAVFGGIAFLGLWFLAEPMARWSDHSPEMHALEVTYFRCLCFCALPFLITAGASSFFAGRGETRVVMLINALGVAVNAPLTYAMIFGHWGLPEWGIAGAGWATVIGTSCSAIFSVALLVRRRFREEFNTLKGWKLEPALLRRMLSFGIPNGMTLALEACAFTIFILIVARFGAAEAAATSIAFTINLTLYLPTAGLGQAVSVLVGQRLGENRDDLAARATWSGLMVGLLFTVIVAGLLVGWPQGLIELFRSDTPGKDWTAIAAIVPTLLLFILVYAAFDCVNLIFSFALRGAGDTRFVTWVMLFAGWPLLVLPTWASWKYDWGLYWAWTFASVYVVFLGTIYVLRFRQGKWRRMRVIEQTADRADFVDEPSSPISASSLHSLPAAPSPEESTLSPEVS